MKVIVGSDGSITFKCPGCGKYHVLNAPGEVRWNFNGDVYKPTLYPSVVCKTMGTGDTICHCVVQNGMIEFLPDSTHPLAGQTVEMPDIEFRRW